MPKQNKQKNVEQQSDTMNTMDQGLNVIIQTFNSATGIDKGNDGKINNKH